MIYFKIKATPNQKFSIGLNGKRVSFRLRYNTTTERWSMDISVDGEEKLVGKRLVAGTDLVKSHNLDIGAIFVSGKLPDYANLVNGTAKIYVATPEEIANG